MKVLPCAGSPCRGPTRSSEMRRSGKNREKDECGTGEEIGSDPRDELGTAGSPPTRSPYRDKILSVAPLHLKKSPSQAPGACIPFPNCRCPPNLPLQWPPTLSHPLRRRGPALPLPPQFCPRNNHGACDVGHGVVCANGGQPGTLRLSLSRGWSHGSYPGCPVVSHDDVTQKP